MKIPEKANSKETYRKYQEKITARRQAIEDGRNLSYREYQQLIKDFYIETKPGTPQIKPGDFGFISSR